MTENNKTEAHDLYLKIWRFLMANHQAEAHKLIPKLMAIAPQWPEATFTRGYALLLRKAYPAAHNDFQQTLKLNPKQLTAQAGTALCLLHLGQSADALLLATTIFDQKVADPIFWHILSELFHTSNELDRYLSCCQQLVALMPNNANMIANLSEAYRYIGQYDEAEKQANKALTLSADNAVILYNRSHIRKQTKNNNHIAALRESLPKVHSWNDEMQLCYALAKELEDIEEYSESFKYLAQGSALRREHSNYQVDGDIATMKLITDTFTPSVFSQMASGFDTEEPIFIMGLPRTGTTLLERILSSHTDVFAAGELHNFTNVMVQAISKNNPDEKLSKQQSVELATQLNWQELGQSYIESTRPRTGHTAKFIDKMPINYLYLGLIAQALPKAKIIVLERDPMDSCYAIFKTLFAQVYPFSYSLDDLGKYYLAWQDLMSHWYQCFPDNIFRLKYEDLVHDTESQSKQLFEFCNLEWQPECLNFHQLKSAVSTASASQVRQPIYSRSIGKWKHFEKQLSPIAALLQHSKP